MWKSRGWEVGGKGSVEVEGEGAGGSGSMEGEGSRRVVMNVGCLPPVRTPEQWQRD